MLPKPVTPRTRPARRSREDYLIAFHDKLIAERKEAIDFLNYYILACYAFIGLAALIRVGAITAFNYQGATIDLKNSRLLEYLSLLILLAYGLIGFHMVRLSNLFFAIRLNASELIGINPQARVVDVVDATLFAPGILGVVIAVARAQTRAVLARLLSGEDLAAIQSAAALAATPSARNAARFVRATYLWGTQLPAAIYQLLLRFLASVILVLMPLVLTATYVLRDRVSFGDFERDDWQAEALLDVLLSVPLSSANGLAAGAVLMAIAVAIVMILLIGRIGGDLLESFALRSQLTLQQMAVLEPGLRRFQHFFRRR